MMRGSTYVRSRSKPLSLNRCFEPDTRLRANRNGSAEPSTIAFEPAGRPTVVENPVKHRGFIVYDRAVVGYRPAAERMQVRPTASALPLL